jgi:tRNA nucleotidyltransferase/poly(A) polymerase
MLNRLQGVFASLHRHNVKYVVIGGIAAVLHGVPRATFDLDILIEATTENAQRLLDALLEARFGTAALTSAQGILAHEITVFKDWVRIDVQTSTPGLVFETAWQRRETMTYQGQEFYVVSKADLIASKRAAGREQDLEDARLLELDSEETQREG